MKILYSTLVLLLSVFIFSCEKKDDLPPILTLNGNDSVAVILNSKYKDEGAFATDEKDGNITANIFIVNTVNEDKIGVYTVTYSVVDKAGNEAKPLTRWVLVYNQGYTYSGYYALKETQIYPGSETCQYQIAANADSTRNYGLVFSSLACNFGQPVFAQIQNSTIILPFQLLANTVSSFSIQGNGTINDTLISINYTLTENDSTELWNATFEKLK
jgi:hypothetical protein